MIIVNDLCGDEDSDYLFKEFLKAYVFNAGKIRYSLEGVMVVQKRTNDYINSHAPKTPEYGIDVDKENKIIHISTKGNK